MLGFDLWVRSDVGSVFVQLFDATLANWLGEMPGLCSMGKVCGHAGVIEHNGDVYSCDHFVFPEYKLGNIMNLSVVEMMSGNAQNEFAKKNFRGLPTNAVLAHTLKLVMASARKTDLSKSMIPTAGTTISAKAIAVSSNTSSHIWISWPTNTRLSVRLRMS